MDDPSLIFAMLIGTLLLVMMVSITGLLLVVNANKRHKHRAELAEAEVRRKQEVVSADRDSREQTLSIIGRELHDSVGQLLTAARMGFSTVPEYTDEPRIMAMGALKEAIDEVRVLGRTLNNDKWKTRTLAMAITDEANRIMRIRTVQVKVLIADDPLDPPMDTKIILYRSFQEALNNALKHADAQHIHIRMSGVVHHTLSITDDGCGFDPLAVTEGTGLLNIRNRCALIGYNATLVTAKGTGCSWTFSPLPNGNIRSADR